MDSQVKRAKIRFSPDDAETSFVSFSLARFENEINTLVINESASGACLLLNVQLTDEKTVLEVGQFILVKVGNLEPVSAIVRWVKKLDDNVLKIGVEYSN